MDATEQNRRSPYLFDTLFNFRDVGGYATRDGRTVRWRRLYRSDSPHRLTATDVEAFAAIGVRTVVDLRRPYEVTRDGRVPGFDGLAYRHIHPEHREWAESRYDSTTDLARYLADRYRDLTDTGARGLAEAVGVIADPAAAPVMVHCVAGKDRTGLVCALTLAALGVADDDIAADYALTDEGMARYLTSTVAGPDTNPLGVPLACPPEAMALFLGELRHRYGSVEEYLMAGGLTADQLTTLRDHLLD
ncbi:protein-tyrosine-phosphatase [Micromonospora echinofusca]|uniref:Protein-tyrosine-phosphatase n=1 Tax=Micromonospora echinofusca TaxID=47858 RepID=A0ABS3VW10_MICEH|nr:tyrosine-protein phosphatase [Micromonospora echinofusca]MBO4208688.1 protein-tyrosine-phosphatase [Micromonospora echinofusca]